MYRWLAVGQQQGIWAAYSSQIISDIVQNIKVTVADVSIIYRDPDLLGEGHVAYSVPHIQVANVPAMTGFARKRLLLQDLEIVWHKTVNSFTHLMEPVEATIDIVKNKSVTPLNNSNPRFKVDLTIEGVSFQLSDKQHSIIYSTWEKLEWFYRKQRYSELRPAAPISSIEDADEKKKLVKSWWKWLLHHTARPIQEYRRTKTKPYLLERIGQLNKYSNIIAKLLKKIELSEEDKANRIEIETLWTYDECRTVIYAVVDKFYSKKTDTTEGQEGMFSWMMRGGGLFRGRAASTGSTQTVTEKSESDENKVSSEPEDTPDPSGINLPKLSLRTTSAATNQYLQDHSVTNDTFLTRDNVFADFSFRLKNGTLKLTIDDGTQLSGLSTIEFNGLQSSLGCRFRAESFTYITELADFKIIDDFTKDSIYPVLVSTIAKGNNSNNSKAMFHFSYEKENLYQRIYCETAPLQMIYNKKLMDIGKGFLNLANSGEDSLYNWRQRERYKGVKEEAKRNISKALTKVMSGKSVNAGGVQVTLDLSAPKILLPQSFKNSDTPQIMIDLGKIKFSNVDEKDEEVEEVERFFTPGGTPPPEEEEESGTSHEEMPTVINAQELQERLLVSKIYHKYSVQLLDLQILVGTKNDTSWRSASAAKKSSMHIVEPFNVSIGIEKRAFDLVDDTKYPMIMVSGSLPSLMLQINESKSSIIFSCLDTCLDPSSDKKTTMPNVNDTLPEVELKASESANLRKLIVIMFQIERVSCGLYSVMHNDQMVAGLEVTRIKANVKLQPEKSHVKLSVGSVVVTNNHEQHLGNDFQSILVSNRNATLDIPSGTIIDSGCTSPTIEEQLAPTPPNFVSQLQENLNKFWNSEQKDAECQSSWSLSDDASEELAVLEWTHYDESHSTEIGDDIHVTFSSLDIVITPDTLSVLLHLLHRLKPAGKKPKCEEEDEKTDNNNKDRLTVLHFEMRTINLMVGVADNGIGRKIATAGIEEFRSVVQIQNPGNVTISGKIGSIFGSDLSFANDILYRKSCSSRKGPFSFIILFLYIFLVRQSFQKVIFM
ncbi:unnamed protein product [Oikopleura dioica]|uniref:Chorein N-terminal domain-containing protein n=1 Tax=Oikopleura dioica TaxID=34765 RepID=E4XAX6_OIKDI|nr:unnamed protein product [Oikopleura dioica]